MPGSNSKPRNWCCVHITGSGLEDKISLKRVLSMLNFIVTGLFRHTISYARISRLVKVAISDVGTQPPRIYKCFGQLRGSLLVRSLQVCLFELTKGCLF